MILTPGVDLPAATITDSCCGDNTIISKKKEYQEKIRDRELARKIKTAEEKNVENVEVVNENKSQNEKSEINSKIHENVEMHCYEECLEISENKTGKISEKDLLLSVIKQMAILGCNGVLLIADTKDRMNDCFDCDTCQKLLVIEKKFKKINPSNSDAEKIRNQDGDNNDMKELRNNAIERIRLLISEKNLSLSEIRDDPGVEDLGTSSILDQGEMKAVRLVTENENRNEAKDLCDTVLNTFDSKNVENIRNDIPESVLHLIKSKITKNPLKVFAIKFWS